MRWDQWLSWHRGDRRWRVTMIDNTGEQPAETADRMLAWMESQRKLLASGELPLSRGWHV